MDLQSSMIDTHRIRLSLALHDDLGHVIGREKKSMRIKDGASKCDGNRCQALGAFQKVY